MTDQARVVTGGVDTHKDFHVAAVVDETGRILDVGSFPASTAGYRALLGWMRGFGTLERVGVEGTGSYGAGLARHLADETVTVVEVNRPNRQTRRRRGKNDTVDAEAAARAALNGEAVAVPKARDGIVESIRALRVAFCSARDTRTRVANQLRDLIAVAPEALRASLEPLATPARADRCARFRPGDIADPVEGTRAAMRSLARRYQTLTVELEELRAQLDVLTARANPGLRGAVGVGVDVASIVLVAAGDNPDRLTSDAAFAALCGASPVEASSGRIVRHRLNRGGNRQANHALWRIAMVRLTCDPRTQHYAQRRSAEGKTPRDIMRCLKRAIAREIYALIVHPPTATSAVDLRAIRRAAGITLATAAAALGTQPARLSEIERGAKPNTLLAPRYTAWLTDQAA
jgi:transposase